MQFDRKTIAALGCGVAIGAILSQAAAQSSMFDPAIVAPHIFETTLENDRVRVLRATTRGGETPPLHTLADRVIVYMSSCAWMETDDDGNKSMESFQPGDVVWAERGTFGGETSNVVHECKSLLIELKD